MANQILENVHAVLARLPRVNSANSDLLKAGYALDALSIGHRVVGFCLEQSSAGHPFGVNAFRTATATRVTPWVAVRAPRPLRAQILHKLKIAYPGNVAVEVYERLSQLNADLPISRRLQLTGQSLERSGRFAEAATAYRDLGELSTSRPDLLQTGHFEPLFRGRSVTRIANNGQRGEQTKANAANSLHHGRDSPINVEPVWRQPDEPSCLERF